MTDKTVEKITIHAKWKKPFFKNGYTQFSVVRELIAYYAGSDQWHREQLTTLFVTTDLDTAKNVRDHFIDLGVTGV